MPARMLATATAQLQVASENVPPRVPLEIPKAPAASGALDDSGVPWAFENANSRGGQPLRPGTAVNPAEAFLGEQELAGSPTGTARKGDTPQPLQVMDITPDTTGRAPNAPPIAAGQRRPRNSPSASVTLLA